MKSIASSYYWHHNCLDRGFSYQLDCFVNLLHCKFLDKIREENELSFSIWVNTQISNASILVDELWQRRSLHSSNGKWTKSQKHALFIGIFCLGEHICCKEKSFSHFFILIWFYSILKGCQSPLHNKIFFWCDWIIRIGLGLIWNPACQSLVWYSEWNTHVIDSLSGYH